MSYLSSNLDGILALIYLRSCEPYPVPMLLVFLNWHVLRPPNKSRVLQHPLAPSKGPFVINKVHIARLFFQLHYCSFSCFDMLLVFIWSPRYRTSTISSFAFGDCQFYCKVISGYQVVDGFLDKQPGYHCKTLEGSPVSTGQSPSLYPSCRDAVHLVQKSRRVITSM